MSFVLSSFHQKKRDFYRCENCHFYYVDPATQISTQEESERYGLHKNDFEDSKYQKYLQDVLTPLKDFLKENSFCELYHLDFGSGKSITTEKILKDWELTSEKSYSYDLYFSPEKSPQLFTSDHTKFDLVTAIEVVEHFKEPIGPWEELISYLKPGGFLFVGTQIFESEKNVESFQKWWYKNDPTHVSIYSIESLNLLAHKYQMELLKTDNKKYFLWRKR